ncbi:MAG: ABC transporter ATP-binding protein, partial [Candidatus Abyssobacteria bacterium SURF_17]
SRKEMDAKIDAIRDFAAIGDFFDRPVRMYSSGMQMRLAFAVATSLEPDILVIDEVLAVGDEDFQKKCLKKMRELRDSRVTVLFVSHILPIVRYHCKNAILLHNGNILKYGKSEEAVDAYYKEISFKKVERESEKESDESLLGNNQDTQEAVINGVQFFGVDGKERETFTTREKITARIFYSSHRPLKKPSISFALFDAEDRIISAHTTHFDGYSIDCLDGEGYFDFCVDDLVLLEGHFKVSISISDSEGLQKYDWHQKKYTLKVVNGPEKAFGVVYLPHHWCGPNARVNT